MYLHLSGPCLRLSGPTYMGLHINEPVLPMRSYLGLFKPIQTYLTYSGCNLGLGLAWPIWACLNLSKSIQAHPSLYGSILTYLVQSGLIWTWRKQCGSLSHQRMGKVYDRQRGTYGSTCFFRILSETVSASKQTQQNAPTARMLTKFATCSKPSPVTTT